MLSGGEGSFPGRNHLPRGCHALSLGALHFLWSLTFWVRIWALPRTMSASIPFGKLLDLSVPQCPHLCNGDNSGTDPIGLFGAYMG